MVFFGTLRQPKWAVGGSMAQYQEADTHSLESTSLDKALAFQQGIIRSECGLRFVLAESS